MTCTNPASARIQMVVLLGRRSVMAGLSEIACFFADDATFSIRRSVFATSVRPVARDPVDHDLWSYWPVGGALDMPNETSFPATSNLLVILLWCVTLGGSILIGWRWSGPARSTVAKTQESRTSDSSRV